MKDLNKLGEQIMPRTASAVSTKLFDDTSQRPAANCETPACSWSHQRNRLRWQASALEVQRPGLSCARKEGSRATGTYSASAILPPGREEGPYFSTEPHRLSVTFRGTRPNDTLVNGVNIRLWQRAALNARVKTQTFTRNGKKLS